MTAVRRLLNRFGRREVVSLPAWQVRAGQEVRVLLGRWEKVQRTNVQLGGPMVIETVTGTVVETGWRKAIEVRRQRVRVDHAGPLRPRPA